MASPPQAVEDQARLLEDALNVVRQQTQLMRRCLESPGKLMDALKCRYVDEDKLVYVGPYDVMLLICAHQNDLLLTCSFKTPVQRLSQSFEQAV